MEDEAARGIRGALSPRLEAQVAALMGAPGLVARVTQLEALPAALEALTWRVTALEHPPTAREAPRSAAEFTAMRAQLARLAARVPCPAPDDTGTAVEVTVGDYVRMASDECSEETDEIERAARERAEQARTAAG